MEEKEMIEKVELIINELKELTKKECYKMVISDEKAKITDSKIGGVPYTPEGEEFVKNEQGDVIPLFVQINFDGIELENYPNKGILQLFINNASELWPADYKIRFYDDISKPARTDFPELDYSNHFVEEEIKINLEKIISYMPHGDFRFKNLFDEIYSKYFGTTIDWYDIEEETGYSVDKFLEAFYTDCGNVGGYADFTQTDPRDDDSDLVECLFKVDSTMDFNRLMIGDSGIAWLLISEEDLKNKKFENASFDWDCC